MTDFIYSDEEDVDDYQESDDTHHDPDWKISSETRETKKTLARSRVCTLYFAHCTSIE